MRSEARGIMVIKKLFAIRDRQRLLAHLESFEWDFARYGPVNLMIGRTDVQCQYTACGNLKNVPVVELIVTDPKYDNVGQVEKIFYDFEGIVQMIRKE